MCVEKNVMSIRGLFALEFPGEMSSMTFLLSGWLIPFEIPAMLLQRVSMPVNGRPAPAAVLGPAPSLPPWALPGRGSLQSVLLRLGLKCFMKCLLLLRWF